MEISIDVNSNKLVIKNQGNEFVVNLEDANNTVITEEELSPTNSLADYVVVEDETVDEEVTTHEAKSLEQRIYEDYLSTGCSMGDLAEKYGTNVYAIRKVLTPLDAVNKRRELKSAEADVKATKKIAEGNEILNMVVNKGYNVSKIARELGKSRSVATRLLREQGIEPSELKYPNNYLKDLLLEYYYNTDLSIREVSRKLNVSISLLYKYVDEFGVGRKRKTTSYPKIDLSDMELKEKIFEAYYNSDEPVREIATRLGISLHALYSFIIEYGEVNRLKGTKESTDDSKGDTDTSPSRLVDYIVPDKEDLDDEVAKEILKRYYETDEAVSSIAEDLEISSMVLYKYLDSYGEGSNRISKLKEALQPKVIELYREGNMTYADISDELGVSHATVGRYIKEYKDNTGYTPKIVPSELEEAICSRYQEGATVTEVQNEFNTSYSKVRKVLKARGLLRKRGGWRDNGKRRVDSKSSELLEPKDLIGSLDTKSLVALEYMGGYSLDHIVKEYGLETNDTNYGAVLGSVGWNDKQRRQINSKRVEIYEEYPRVLNLYYSKSMGYKDIAMELDLDERIVALYIFKVQESTLA